MATPLNTGWIDVFPEQESHLVQEAAKWMEKKPVSADHATLFDAIGQGSEALGKQNFAQYFTPPDVALAAAFSLPNGPVFDPSAGKGSLLIAAGTAMAMRGVTGKSLLQSLHGVEICPDTHAEMLVNIAKGLQRWHGLPIDEAVSLLHMTIKVQDFYDWDDDLHDKIVLMNPPYKEMQGKNQWLLFMDKILSKKPDSLCAILPISITCSNRAQSIRNALAQYRFVRAFHHEIRPRALFPKVEQRITIVTLRNDLPTGFETTGFLTHRAKEREKIWIEPMVRFDAFNPESFVKVSPSTLPFYFSQQTGQRLKDLDPPHSVKEEIWIRISGRYSLLAQRQAPEEITSKWKRLTLFPKAANEVIAAFENGDALSWWRMFGDGRDFPINRFLETWKIPK